MVYNTNALWECTLNYHSTMMCSDIIFSENTTLLGFSFNYPGTVPKLYLVDVTSKDVREIGCLIIGAEAVVVII